VVGRKLKRYQDYKSRLKFYARAVNIKITYITAEDESAYLPTQRKICLERDLPESVEIAVLLHELGHSLDDALVNKTTMNEINAAYHAVYSDKANKIHKYTVIETEKRAWQFGKVIARICRIPIGNWYYKAKRSCLRAYTKD